MTSKVYITGKFNTLYDELVVKSETTTDRRGINITGLSFSCPSTAFMATNDLIVLRKLITVFLETEVNE